MRLIDADKFLKDLLCLPCDVCDTDERYPAYSEFGHSFEQIERLVNKQKTVEVTKARVRTNEKNQKKRY